MIAGGDDQGAALTLQLQREGRAWIVVVLDPSQRRNLDQSFQRQMNHERVPVCGHG